MKTRAKIALCCVILPFLLATSACGMGASAQLANELRFPLEDITSITISYDEEAIHFYTCSGDMLTIKEYMSADRRNYHAKVREKRDSIHVSEGGKPLFGKGFTRYVEVYLPSTYRHSLTVTSTSGQVDLSDVKLDLSRLRIDNKSGQTNLSSARAREMHLSSTSGRIEGGLLQAYSIRLETTSGQITCDELNGEVEYTTTSGDLVVRAASGAGSYRADNSGALQVHYQNLDGDLSLYNKSEDILLSLPPDAAFTFEAKSKNGALSTDFPEALRIEGGKAYGVVGRNPSAKVYLETKDGDIEVRR